MHNEKKIFLFIFLALILTFDFVFTLNGYFHFWNVESSFLGIPLTIAVFLKALFFLPIIIFQQLGNILGYGGDYFYIPPYWQFVTYGIGLGFAFYLSAKLTNRQTKGAFLWYHAILLSFYLFIFASLLIIWHFNPYSVVSPALKQSYVLLISSFLTYISIPVLLYTTKKYLRKKND